MMYTGIEGEEAVILLGYLAQSLRQLDEETTIKVLERISALSSSFSWMLREKRKRLEEANAKSV